VERSTSRPRSRVAESVADPLRYYEVHVGSVVAPLASMQRRGVGLRVFFPSAAVQGYPDVSPVTEQTPKVPPSPYSARPRPSLSV
jgi:UDP-glucose 4-epimerase